METKDVLVLEDIDFILAELAEVGTDDQRRFHGSPETQMGSLFFRRNTVTDFWRGRRLVDAILRTKL